MVIICGSLISMMESQVLAYNSPLYGRRTAQIRLKQITFEYYKEFFSSRSDNELIERYAVTGGVPKYIELFTDESDIYNAIYNNILSKSGYLYDEPNFLLRQEVTEVGRYWNSKTEIDICALDPEGNRNRVDLVKDEEGERDHAHGLLGIVEAVARRHEGGGNDLQLGEGAGERVAVGPGAQEHDQKHGQEAHAETGERRQDQREQDFFGNGSAVERAETGVGHCGSHQAADERVG